MSNLGQWLMTVNKLHGKREHLEATRNQLEVTLTSITNELQIGAQAREIVQSVAKLTQQQLEQQLSTLTSLAMNAVFDEPYALHVEFVERRSKTECDISFKRGDSTIDPLTASGGGAVDIAALGLRLSLWGMMVHRTRPTFLLDEPLRFLSADYRSKAASLLRYLCEQLNVQIIMVTHTPEFVEQASTIYEVRIDKGISNPIAIG